MNNYYVYIMSNTTGTLYVGVTNNLSRRVYEHKNGVVDGFTKQYDVHRLVYFEQSVDIQSAISREKQIKGWTRQKKIDLIKAENPNYQDLSEEWEP